MKFGGMEVISTLVFTLVLDGGVCEVHATAILPSGKRPGIHWIGDWVDLWAPLDALEKSLKLQIPELFSMQFCA
jgi:hypothetical protein